jgi:hypothetical protein
VSSVRLRNSTFIRLDDNVTSMSPGLCTFSTQGAALSEMLWSGNEEQAAGRSFDMKKLKIRGTRKSFLPRILSEGI